MGGILSIKYFRNNSGDPDVCGVRVEDLFLGETEHQLSKIVTLKQLASSL